MALGMDSSHGLAVIQKTVSLTFHKGRCTVWSIYASQGMWVLILIWIRKSKKWNSTVQKITTMTSTEFVMIWCDIIWYQFDQKSRKRSARNKCLKSWFCSILLTQPRFQSTLQDHWKGSRTHGQQKGNKGTTCQHCYHRGSPVKICEYHDKKAGKKLKDCLDKAMPVGARNGSKKKFSSCRKTGHKHPKNVSRTWSSRAKLLGAQWMLYWPGITDKLGGYAQPSVTTQKRWKQSLTCQCLSRYGAKVMHGSATLAHQVIQQTTNQVLGVINKWYVVWDLLMPTKQWSQLIPLIWWITRWNIGIKCNIEQC